MRALSLPYLPEHTIFGVLVDFRTDQKIIKNIEKLGIAVYRSREVQTVHPAIQGHADIGLCHVGKETFVCEPTLYEYYKQLFDGLPINLIAGKSILTSTYPQDIAYNVARIGSFAFHNFSHCDPKISEQFKRLGVHMITVAQGYSKCNLCPISENALITEDESIYKHAVKAGFDVLKIAKGYVRLDGFPYGFFGGASGMLGPKCLAVTGSLCYHPDRKAISAFCAKYDVKIYELSQEIPVDIGSILPIFEE